MVQSITKVNSSAVLGDSSNYVVLVVKCIVSDGMQNPVFFFILYLHIALNMYEISYPHICALFLL